MKIFQIPFLITIFVMLYSCGGGGSASTPAPINPSTGNTNPAPMPVVISGTIANPIVTGLSFRSGSQSGMLGSDGSYSCEQGTDIVFSIGSQDMITTACGTSFDLDALEDFTIRQAMVVLTCATDVNSHIGGGSIDLDLQACSGLSNLNFGADTETFKTALATTTGKTAVGVAQYIDPVLMPENGFVQDRGFVENPICPNVSLNGQSLDIYIRETDGQFHPTGYASRLCVSYIDNHDYAPFPVWYVTADNEGSANRGLASGGANFYAIALSSADQKFYVYDGMSFIATANSRDTDFRFIATNTTATVNGTTYENASICVSEWNFFGLPVADYRFTRIAGTDVGWERLE